MPYFVMRVFNDMSMPRGTALILTCFIRTAGVIIEGPSREDEAKNLAKGYIVLVGAGKPVKTSVAPRCPLDKVGVEVDSGTTKVVPRPTTDGKRKTRRLANQRVYSPHQVTFR
jgi:hypothetical protein